MGWDSSPGGGSKDFLQLRPEHAAGASVALGHHAVQGLGLLPRLYQTDHHREGRDSEYTGGIEQVIILRPQDNRGYLQEENIFVMRFLVVC